MTKEMDLNTGFCRYCQSTHDLRTACPEYVKYVEKNVNSEVNRRKSRGNGYLWAGLVAILIGLLMFCWLLSEIGPHWHF